jgi:hypothetical protein
MTEMTPVTALTAALFPDWLAETARIASVRAASADTVRFRVDPGRAFERYAELERHPGSGGELFTLTVSQRFRPSEDLHPVVSGEVHRDQAAEALWRAVSHADLLVPNYEYWRAGWPLQRPLWSAQADARQPGAARVMEALATVRARETGRPHFLSRMGHRVHCNVNAPYHGEFYSVNRAGEWSLHYHPVTYPLESPPTAPPDRIGTHPAVLAYERNIAETYAQRRRAALGRLPPPVVEFPGKAALPLAAWPPEKFYIPFRVRDRQRAALRPPPPAPAAAAEPAVQPRPATELQPAAWNLVKELAMPEPASTPTAITGDSPPAGDPWEGAHAEVQLAPEPARYAQAAGLAQAGFVIDLGAGTSDTDRACVVHFPGKAGTITVPDDLLTPAAPFPAVTTSAGVIASIESAEALLIDCTARARVQQEQDKDPDLVLHDDRIKLARALSNMCGMDPQELVRQLEPMIGQQVTNYRQARTRHPAGRKRASEVAAADIPAPRPAPSQAQDTAVPVPAATPAASRPKSRTRM